MDARPFWEDSRINRPHGRRISEDEWGRHKDKLRALHEANLTRQEILTIISKDFGNPAPTYGQLCTIFDKWGFHVHRGKRTNITPNESQEMTVEPEQSATKVDIIKPTNTSQDVCHACGRQYGNINIDGSGTTILGDVINHFYVYEAVEKAVDQALQRLLRSDPRPETIRQSMASVTDSIAESILEYRRDDNANAKKPSSKVVTEVAKPNINKPGQNSNTSYTEEWLTAKVKK